MPKTGSKKTSGKSREKKFQISKLEQKPEGLSKAGSTRPACEFCGLCNKTEHPFEVPEVGDEWTGKVVVVTEPLGKKARAVVSRAYESAGYQDRDIVYVSPVRCITHRKPNMGQIRACRPFLLKVLDTLKPKAVLGMGATALRALTNKSDANLTKNRGQLIKL